MTWPMNNWVVEAVYLSMLMTSFCTGRLAAEMTTWWCRTLSTWVDGNILTSNASKCKYIIISRLPALTLYGEPLEKVSLYKYLRVTITEDLSWSTHIDQISSKARRIIYRQFYTWSSHSTLLQLYTSLVRPHLEYATQVWNPYLIKNIQKLESVQKFALKMCCNNGIYPMYAATLELCSLPELKERRSHLSLFYFYKLVNGIFDFPYCPLTLHQLSYPSHNGRTNNIFPWTLCAYQPFSFHSNYFCMELFALFYRLISFCSIF